MGAGKKFKFQGSTIAVLTEFGADSPPIAITGITKANPAVVTAAAHGLESGDVIEINNVVGMTEVNDDIYIVEVLSPSTFSLLDTDSTDYSTYASGGTFEVGTMSNFCELTDYNRQGGASPEIPATSLCSTAQEYEIGLPDFGTTQLSFNFAPRTTVQGALHDFYLSGDKTAIKVVLPKNGGEMVQLGFVQQESEQAGVGGMWVATGTLRNTGNRYDVAAA